jgi:hypothetical protein
MDLRTATDGGVPRVAIVNVFTASDRTFMVLSRRVRYAAREPLFLAELTGDVIMKRHMDGSEEPYPKMLVRDGVPARQVRRMADQKPGTHFLPWVGMRPLRSTISSRRLRVVPPSKYAEVVGDQVYKLVAGR